MGVRTRVGKEDLGNEGAITACVKVAAGQLVVEDDRMARLSNAGRPACSWDAAVRRVASSGIGLHPGVDLDRPLGAALPRRPSARLLRVAADGAPCLRDQKELVLQRKALCTGPRLHP